MIRTLIEHPMALVAIIVAVVAVLAAAHERFTRRISAANTYDAAVETHESTVRRTNDAAITARHLLWKRGATDTGIALNGAADIPLGTVDNTETATGLSQTVNLLGKGTTKKMVASEAMATTGVKVYAAASGKIALTGSVEVGTLLTAAGADGDIVEVQDCEPRVVGFRTGAGGAVTQITSASTGVTLNKASGQITTVALTTAAGAEERFTVTNSNVAATDAIALGTTYNGAGTPALSVVNVAAGAFDIVITNLHAANALNAVLVANFAVIKGANS